MASDKSGGSSSESLSEERTEFATERSVEAAGRTLMAAVRTAVSMISFGFTIAKFFEYLGKFEGHQSSHPSSLVDSPHHLGLLLLVGGTLTITLGLVEYVGYVRSLPAAPIKKPWLSAALFSAAFVLAMGLLLSGSLVVDLAS